MVYFPKGNRLFQRHLEIFPPLITMLHFLRVSCSIMERVSRRGVTPKTPERTITSKDNESIKGWFNLPVELEVGLVY